MTNRPDADDLHVIDMIAEHGWNCIAVSADDDGPGFAYTMGFWETLGAPEFVVCGLPNELMHGMLWTTFRQIRDGNTGSYDNRRWSDLISDFDCISRAVHPSQIGCDYFSYSMWYRRYRAGPDAGLTAYQLFWPGKLTGLFPWEKGCSEEVRGLQPQLYLPRESGIA